MVLSYNDLNDRQQQAVDYSDGNLLVLAGAGSGKTATMVQRYKKHLENGESPKQLAMITYNRKPAQELRDKVVETTKYDEDDIRNTVCTVNQFYSTIWEMNYEKLGWDSFEYMDDNNNHFQDTLIRFTKNRKMKNLPYTDNEVFTFIQTEISTISRGLEKAIQESISTFKDPSPSSSPHFTGDDESTNGVKLSKDHKYDIYHYLEDHIIKIKELYLELMVENEEVNYIGTVYFAHQLLKQNKDVRDTLGSIYNEIIFDEAQDLTPLRYSIIENISKNSDCDLVLIGDDAQCLPENEKVEVKKNGEKEVKKISNVEIGDKVLTAKGNGEYGFHEVSNKISKPFNGELHKYTTESGRKITVTPDHEMLARVDTGEIDSDRYYTYLMKSADGRWRLGTTTDLSSRLNVERFARGIIPIESYESKGEALYHEKLYSKKYEIPVTVFTNRQTNNEDHASTMKEKWRDQLYNDLECDVERLAQECDIDLTTFAKVKKSTTRGRTESLNVNLKLNIREQSNYMAHRLASSTMNSHFNQRMDEIDDLNKGEGKGETTRWRKWSDDLGYLRNLADEIVEKTDGYVVEQFSVTTQRKNALVIPSKNIVEGMKVPVRKDGDVIFEKIESKEEIEYDGKVYDLEVPYTNVFGNSEGIFVHNCIYAYQGARSEIMNTRFVQTNPELIRLNINYRSTQQIIDITQTLRDKMANVSHHDIKSVYGFDGRSVNQPNYIRSQYSFTSQDKEYQELRNATYELAEDVAERVKQMIRYEDVSPDEIALLSRTGTYSQAYANKLQEEDVPYTNLNNTTDFKDRREVKLFLRYLRCVWDESRENLDELIKSEVGGVGEKTLEKIRQQTSEDYIIDALASMDKDSVSGVGEKTVEKIQDFLGVYLKVMNWSHEVEVLKDELDYEKRISKMSNTEDQYDSRLERVEALKDSWERSSSPDDFFEKLETSESGVVISTIHKAKGREWEHVFLVDMGEKKFVVDDQDELKVFYVAVSRAKTDLTFCFINDMDLETRKLLGENTLEKMVGEPDYVGV